MAFSPPVLGCLVKKGLQKGGSRVPQDPPGYTLEEKEKKKKKIIEEEEEEQQQQQQEEEEEEEEKE